MGIKSRETLWKGTQHTHLWVWASQGRVSAGLLYHVCAQCVGSGWLSVTSAKVAQKHASPLSLPLPKDVLYERLKAKGFSFVNKKV